MTYWQCAVPARCRLWSGCAKSIAERLCQLNMSNASRTPATAILAIPVLNAITARDAFFGRGEFCYIAFGRSWCFLMLVTGTSLGKSAAELRDLR